MSEMWDANGEEDEDSAFTMKYIENNSASLNHQREV
jgi:hypothetical protein